MKQETKDAKQRDRELTISAVSPLAEQLPADMTETQRLAMILLAMGNTQQGTADTLGVTREYVGQIACANKATVAALAKTRDMVMSQFLKCAAVNLASLGFQAVPGIAKRVDDLTANELKAICSAVKDLYLIADKIDQSDHRPKSDPVTIPDRKRTISAIEALESRTIDG